MDVVDGAVVDADKFTQHQHADAEAAEGVVAVPVVRVVTVVSAFGQQFVGTADAEF